MLDKLKKIFGFGDIEEQDELIADDPDLKSPAESPFAPVGESQSGAPLNADATEVTGRIFDRVLVVFNDSMPDFLKKSVDPERQKQALYEALSDDIKAHLKSLESSVTARLDEAWRSERERLQTDIKNISQTAKDIEAKRAELKTQQLSADRQKRAMSERIHDLEKQVLAIEAEKEQLELENKSMINKVKVAQVYEKDMEAMREQVASLQAELNNRRVGAEVPDGAEISIDSEKEIAALREEKARLKEEKLRVEQEKSQLSDESRKTAQEKAKLEEENKRLSKIEEEYNQLIEHLDTVEHQMTLIEKVTEEKDSKIASLREQLKKATDNLDRRTRELEKLKAEFDSAHGEPEPPREPAPMTMPADDDILNDTDWIVRPSNKQPSAQKFERNKNKKPNRNEDGQMSLW